MTIKYTHFKGLYYKVRDSLENEPGSDLENSNEGINSLKE